MILLLTTLTLSLAALAQGAAEDAPCLNPVVDGALRNIEASGASLTSFTADISYRKDEALLDRSEIRGGRVVFDRSDREQGVLGIRFDTRVLGDRLEHERKRIVFRDGWLIEIDEPRQLTIKRQLVPEGETMDPMRLGGPFPLPVGQPRDSVLKRFSVRPIAPPTHAMFRSIAGVPGLVGLSLTPRTTTPEADDWTRIDLWYDPTTWLPLGVEAVEVNGDVRRIRLTGATRNAPLSSLDQGVLFAESPVDDWTVEVRPLPPSRSPAHEPTDP